MEILMYKSVVMNKVPFYKYLPGLCVSLILPFAILANTFTIYTSDNGLSQNTVNDIVQDSAGFLWIATQDGLNFFDGSQFITFYNIPDDSASLSHNFIHTVYVDGQNVWIGTKNGLNKLAYDSLKNKIYFERFFPTQSGGSGATSDNITAIYRDSRNNLFVGTSKGLLQAAFKPGTRHILSFFKPSFDADMPDVLSKKYIRNIVEDHKKNLWCALLSGGIVHYNLTTGRFSHFDNAARAPYKLPTGFVTQVFIDSRNRLWAGYYG